MRGVIKEIGYNYDGTFNLTVQYCTKRTAPGKERIIRYFNCYVSSLSIPKRNNKNVITIRPVWEKD